jgi:tensin
MLKRIIMSEAPKFGKRQAVNSEGEEDTTSEALLGCAPYLQIFKAGNLIFTTAASVNYAQTKDDLPFCAVGSGPVSFLAEAVVQGDILLRCRHLTKSGQRISMFRCAFHTGYVPPKVLRLTKAQLDGACGDKRFADDFFLDLIFEPCDEATASQHLAEKAATSSDEAKEDDCANEAANRRSMGTVVGNSETTFTASAYDSMLHRDSRFWDVITERRKENMAKMAELEKQGGKSDSVINEDNLPLFGPTIGKRRDFATKQSSENDEDPSAKDGASGANSKNQQNPMSAFSIGEEFGIDLEPVKPPTAPTSAFAPPSPPPQPKQDALMDALNDLDTDLLDDDMHNMTEEISFDHSEVTPMQLPTADSAGKAEIAVSPTVADVTKDDTIPSNGASDGGASDAQEVKTSPPETKEDILDTMVDDFADIVNDTGDDDLLGDAGQFDDFDDLEDDAELEDLENFLTQVSTK